MYRSGSVRRRKYDKNTDGFAYRCGLLNTVYQSSMFGFFLFDSIHPLVYPLRVELPVVCEAGMWTYDALKARRNARQLLSRLQSPDALTQTSSSQAPAPQTLEQRAQAEPVLSVQENSAPSPQAPPAPEQRPPQSPTIYPYIPLEPYTPEEAAEWKAEQKKRAGEDKPRAYFFRKE